MVLRELIDFLNERDPDKVVPVGFYNPHSYRGYYEDLAFEPAENVSVREMLKCAQGAVSRTFTGYKGGDYTMGEYTTVWLAGYGHEGEGIGPILLRYMLGEVPLDEAQRNVASVKPGGSDEQGCRTKTV